MKLVKWILVLILVLLIGGLLYISFSDPEIVQQTVTKTIDPESLPVRE